MVRPVNADAAATRRRILDSALEIFAEQGPSATSLRQIARNAGVSVAMVSHYFGTKEELHEACVDSMYEKVSGLQSTLIAEMSDANGLPALIERAVRVCFHFVRQHQTAARLLNRTVMESGGLDAHRRTKQRLPFLETTSHALAGWAGRTPDEVRLILQSMISLVSRYAISSGSELMAITGANSEEEALRRVEEHLVHLAAYAIAARPPLNS